MNRVILPNDSNSLRLFCAVCDSPIPGMNRMTMLYQRKRNGSNTCNPPRSSYMPGADSSSEELLFVQQQIPPLPNSKRNVSISRAKTTMSRAIYCIGLLLLLLSLAGTAHSQPMANGDSTQSPLTVLYVHLKQCNGRHLSGYIQRQVMNDIIYSLKVNTQMKNK